MHRGQSNMVYTGTQTEELEQGIEGIINNIKQKRILQDWEEEDIRWTAGLCMDAHEGAMRVDGLNPYFSHPLEVTDELITTFDITDLVAIDISMMHDTREDVRYAYEKIKKIMEQAIQLKGQDGIPTHEGRVRFNLMRLGVRMLSNLYESEYSKEFEGMDHSESNKLLERYYLVRMVHPDIFYHKHLIDPEHYSPYGPEFIRHVQLIKLSDRIVNTGDMLSLFAPEAMHSFRGDTLPERTFKRTAEDFIPILVEPSLHLTNYDRKLFYDRVIGILEDYTRLKDPRFDILKKAATEALDKYNYLALRAQYSNIQK